MALPISEYQIITVDQRPLIGYIAQLQGMRESTLPRVFKKTLDRAAMDVKQNTMPLSAKTAFTDRTSQGRGNFFKAKSKVVFVPNSNKNLATMQSSVGFVEPEAMKAGKAHAVSDLEQQEDGGTIEDRTLIPMKTARVGGNLLRLVSAINYIRNR